MRRYSYVDNFAILSVFKINHLELRVWRRRNGCQSISTLLLQLIVSTKLPGLTMATPNTKRNQKLNEMLTYNMHWMTMTTAHAKWKRICSFVARFPGRKLYYNRNLYCAHFVLYSAATRSLNEREGIECKRRENAAQEWNSRKTSANQWWK